MSLIDGLIISEILQPTQLSRPKHFKTTLMAASKGNSSRSFVAGTAGRSEDRRIVDRTIKTITTKVVTTPEVVVTKTVDWKPGALVYLSGPVLLGDFKNYSYPYLPNLTDPRIPWPTSSKTTGPLKYASANTRSSRSKVGVIEKKEDSLRQELIKVWKKNLTTVQVCQICRG